MACPKFDPKNKKHLAILGILILVVIAIIAVVVYFTVFNKPSLSSFEGPIEEYQNHGLKLHNEHRKVHHAPPLKLSNDLNTLAKACANYYAEKNTIDHSCSYKKDFKGGSVGENLYMSWGKSGDKKDAMTNADKGWYDENKDYDYASGKSKNGKAVGHFTQLVWDSSQEVGFGYYKKGNAEVVVAIYKPPGNYVGQYTQHVKRP